MTLLEAFKCCSIENLDTTELIYDCDYNAYEEDHEVYELFMHNLKCLAIDELFAEIGKIELTDDVKKDLVDTGGEEHYGEDILSYIVGAAWLTYNDVKLPVEWDDALVVEDVYEYEIICSKADLNIHAKMDLDMS